MDKEKTLEQTILDRILLGATAEVRKAVEDSLVLYTTPAKDPQEETFKVAKLRAAYDAVQTWLMKEKIPNLNDEQWLFLSTGAIGPLVRFGEGDEGFDLEVYPQAVYDALVKARAAKRQRPAWAMPVLDMEDRILAIAKGELVGMDPRQTRRRPKATKPIGSDQVKEKVKVRVESIVAGFLQQLKEFEGHITVIEGLREDASMKNLRGNLEAMKRYAILIAQGSAPLEQRVKIVAPVSEKLAGVFPGMNAAAEAMAKAAARLSEINRELESRFNELRGNLSEYGKLQTGGDATAALFDAEMIETIRRDADTLAQFVVRAAEAAENKVPFSACRILVPELWKFYDGTPTDCLCTSDAVMRSVEKLTKLHINAFPRDNDGHPQLPPILIEPIRNYVEYFDDRIVMSFVSGEAARKGSKVSLTPVDVQVLRLMGIWLTKDDIYDYRGEINAGTFIGDYSGKVEKTTKVKWTGEDKKFSMAVSSQVQDGASRGEAIADYMDFLFAAVNGLSMPQRLSRRKIAVLLRFCQIESVEKTIALTLMYVAQAEPDLAKETIFTHIRNEEEAKTVVNKVLDDPQVAKLCGDRNFFIAKLFGKQS